MEIRSYRAVFDLERRIYRVDRLRLNPSGVPVRGVVYFMVLLAAILLAGRLPLLEDLAGVFPWYIVDLALPGLSAALLTVIRIDGRPSHLAIRSLARFRLGASERGGVCARRSGSRARFDAPGARWCPQELLVLPDGSDMRMRRLRYRGPGAVRVTAAHSHSEGGTRHGVASWLARRYAIAGAKVRLREVGDSDPPSKLDVDAAGRERGDGVVIALAPGVRLLVG
jgi:hypothetical protein